MGDSNQRIESEEIREQGPDAWPAPAAPEPPHSDKNLTAGAARASVDAMTTDERLTWEQICERYPAQWVVMIDHDWQPHNISEFKTARVLAVGSSRIEAKGRARPQLDSIYEWGCHFTGPLRGPELGYRPWFVP